MRFEWEEAKNQANRRKHGLDFADAPLVFSGRTLTFEDVRQPYDEPRYLTVKANARERTRYQERLGENR